MISTVCRVTCCLFCCMRNLKFFMHQKLSFPFMYTTYSLTFCSCSLVVYFCQKTVFSFYDEEARLCYRYLITGSLKKIKKKRKTKPRMPHWIRKILMCNCCGTSCLYVCTLLAPTWTSQKSGWPYNSVSIDIALLSFVPFTGWWVTIDLFSHKLPSQ